MSPKKPKSPKKAKSKKEREDRAKRARNKDRNREDKATRDVLKALFLAGQREGRSFGQDAPGDEASELCVWHGERVRRWKASVAAKWPAFWSEEPCVGSERSFRGFWTSLLTSPGLWLRLHESEYPRSL